MSGTISPNYLYNFRLFVATMARAASDADTAQKKIDIARQREKLDDAITSFYQAARPHLPPSFLTGEHALTKDCMPDGQEWDDVQIYEEGGKADGNNSAADPARSAGSAAEAASATTPVAIPAGSGTAPGHIDGVVEPGPPRKSVGKTASLDSSAIDRAEQRPVPLPSSFGILALRQHSLMGLVLLERQLRVGQMNDALQRLRTGIGYKSLLFRWKICNASSFRSRLRSHNEAHLAQRAVLKEVRIYMAARRSLLSLFDAGDPTDWPGLEEIKAKYKVIVPADIRASTTVLEAFTPGLRNEHAAWFWTIGNNPDAEKEDNWMYQCKLYTLTHFPVPMMYQFPDRRMLWLRAHARMCRWSEEAVIVPLEMAQTVRSFERKADQWRQWADSAESPGHKAYAHAQQKMWQYFSTLR